MEKCPNLSGCPFVKYCNDHDAGQSVQGFIKLYCEGAKQEACIRKRLCTAFSRTVVPPNMMPNGYPIPGTDRNGWSNEAVNHLTLLR